MYIYISCSKHWIEYLVVSKFWNDECLLIRLFDWQSILLWPVRLDIVETMENIMELKCDCISSVLLLYIYLFIYFLFQNILEQNEIFSCERYFSFFGLRLSRYLSVSFTLLNFSLLLLFLFYSFKLINAIKQKYFIHLKLLSYSLVLVIVDV